jgi:hypothetical protein
VESLRRQIGSSEYGHVSLRNSFYQSVLVDEVTDGVSNPK